MDKKRSINWSKEEKKFLFSLVQKRINSIENKSVSTNTNMRKEEAWKEIHNEFSAIFGGKDILCLKEQWKRQKARAKASVQKLKKNHKSTGAGLAPEGNAEEDSLKDRELDIVVSLPHEFSKDEAEFESNEDVIEIQTSSMVTPVGVSNTSLLTSVTPKSKKMEAKVGKKRTLSTKESCLSLTEYEKQVFQLQRAKYHSEAQRAEQLHNLHLENLKKQNERAEELHNLHLKNLKLQNEELLLKEKLMKAKVEENIYE